MKKRLVMAIFEHSLLPSSPKPIEISLTTSLFRERQKSKEREIEWEQLREAALRNKGSIEHLPDTILKAAPPRILSPFDEQAEQQEQASGGMLSIDNTMQSFNNSMSSQFEADAGDEVLPSTDDLEDTHGEMVGRHYTLRQKHLN